MAPGNIKEVRQRRNKQTGSPLLDKSGSPMSYRTHNTGNLNAAFKASRMERKRKYELGK